MSTMCQCCATMCMQCMQTLVCMWQAVMRLILNLCLMVENLFRLLLNSIYNIISFILQICTIIPLCCIFLLTSKLGCSNCFSSGCGNCSIMGSNHCQCILGIIITIILYFIFDSLGWIDIILSWLGVKVVKMEENELDLSPMWELAKTTVPTITYLMSQYRAPYRKTQEMITTEMMPESIQDSESTRSIMEMIELLRRKLSSKMPSTKFNKASTKAALPWSNIRQRNTPRRIPVKSTSILPPRRIPVRFTSILPPRRISMRCTSISPPRRIPVKSTSMLPYENFVENSDMMEKDISDIKKRNSRSKYRMHPSSHLPSKILEKTKQLTSENTQASEITSESDDSGDPDIEVDDKQAEGDNSQINKVEINDYFIDNSTDVNLKI